MEDTLRYVPILAQEGVDLFDMSSGGTDRRQQVQLGPQYQVPFAKAVKSLNIPGVFVSAVGWIRDGATVHDVCLPFSARTHTRKEGRSTDFAP